MDKITIPIDFTLNKFKTQIITLYQYVLFYNIIDIKNENNITNITLDISDPYDKFNKNILENNMDILKEYNIYYELNYNEHSTYNNYIDFYFKDKFIINDFINDNLLEFIESDFKHLYKFITEKDSEFNFIKLDTYEYKIRVKIGTFIGSVDYHYDSYLNKSIQLKNNYNDIITKFNSIKSNDKLYNIFKLIIILFKFYNNNIFNNKKNELLVIAISDYIIKFNDINFIDYINKLDKNNINYNMNILYDNNSTIKLLLFNNKINNEYSNDFKIINDICNFIENNKDNYNDYNS